MNIDTRPENPEAGDYIEDDPAAWTAFVEAVRRYAPRFASLAEFLETEDGAAEVVAGSMLSFLADQRSVFVGTAEGLAALDTTP